MTRERSRDDKDAATTKTSARPDTIDAPAGPDAGGDDLSVAEYRFVQGCSSGVKKKTASRIPDPSNAGE